MNRALALLASASVCALEFFHTSMRNLVCDKAILVWEIAAVLFAKLSRIGS